MGGFRGAFRGTSRAREGCEELLIFIMDIGVFNREFMTFLSEKIRIPFHEVH